MDFWLIEMCKNHFCQIWSYLGDFAILPICGESHFLSLWKLNPQNQQKFHFSKKKGLFIFWVTVSNTYLLASLKAVATSLANMPRKWAWITIAALRFRKNWIRSFQAKKLSCIFLVAIRTSTNLRLCFWPFHVFWIVVAAFLSKFNLLSSKGSWTQPLKNILVLPICHWVVGRPSFCISTLSRKKKSRFHEIFHVFLQCEIYSHSVERRKILSH